MAPHVMTVSGPIPPERVGFTLPHEHTGLQLWHVPNRWDYFELTPDELGIAEELRDFRRRGGLEKAPCSLVEVGEDRLHDRGIELEQRFDRFGRLDALEERGGFGRRQRPDQRREC